MLNRATSSKLSSPALHRACPTSPPVTLHNSATKAHSSTECYIHTQSIINRKTPELWAMNKLEPWYWFLTNRVDFHDAWTAWRLQIKEMRARPIYAWFCGLHAVVLHKVHVICTISKSKLKPAQPQSLHVSGAHLVFLAGGDTLQSARGETWECNRTGRG